jgi:hypothetical protein
MGKWAIGFLGALALLAVATPATAQPRPQVSASESSTSSGPTCVVNGVVSDCAGSAAPVAGTIVPGLVIGSVPVVGPFPGAGFGGSEDGHAGTDVDVQRSTRSGIAVTR